MDAIVKIEHLRILLRQAGILPVAATTVEAMGQKVD